MKRDSAFGRKHIKLNPLIQRSLQLRVAAKKLIRRSKPRGIGVEDSDENEIDLNDITFSPCEPENEQSSKPYVLPPLE